MPNKSAILELLIELWDQGLLTGSDIEFDGRPIALYSEPEEWRPDGKSVETSHGCRRDRLIDYYLEALGVGDRFEREIAESFPRWFCFNPHRYPDLVAADEGEKDLARAAYNRWVMIGKWMQGGRTPIKSYPFEVRVPKPENPGVMDALESYPGHAVVLQTTAEHTAPADWPAAAIAEIDAAVAMLRNPVNNDFS